MVIRYDLKHVINYGDFESLFSVPFGYNDSCLNNIVEILMDNLNRSVAYLVCRKQMDQMNMYRLAFDTYGCRFSNMESVYPILYMSSLDIERNMMLINLINAMNHHLYRSKALKRSKLIVRMRSVQRWQGDWLFFSASNRFSVINQNGQKMCTLNVDLSNQTSSLVKGYDKSTVNSKFH